MNRVKQFVRAITAHIDSKDRKYISIHLDDMEQDFFYAQSMPDQCHALNVSYTAETIYQSMRSDRDKVDVELLIRSALLHDIGRTKNDMGIHGKVFAVLMHKFMPRTSMNWACPSRKGFLGFWRHVMYVYYHHPEIGAHMLENIGRLKESAIISRHHKKESPGDPLELRILRKADELN